MNDVKLIFPKIDLQGIQVIELGNTPHIPEKACLVQIINTLVNLSKHTRILRLYGWNTSSKLYRTFAERLLQAWESGYNFKKHFKKTILKRKVI